MRIESRTAVWIAGIAYLWMLGFVWGMFSTTSGLPYETQLAYLSQTTPGWSGFLYPPDPLRVFTNIFYHLSYVAGKALGISGSFIPYQFVYAGLWFGRSLLAFLILRRLLPGSGLLLPFLTGAFVLLHASDLALGWIGQMNQFGFMLWLLLALYFVIVAWQAVHWTPAILAAAAASLFEYLCLWSYESPLFILCVAPPAFALMLRPAARRMMLLIPWYLIPLAYLRLSYLKYVAGHTYQQSVMRQHWSWGELLGDWLFNVRLSLAFWSWGSQPHAGPPQVNLLAMCALAGFLAAAVWLACLERSQVDEMPRRIFLAGVLGFTFLVASFPAYLFLESIRNPWRTQFLSGLGAAMVFSATLGLAGTAARRREVRAAVLILGAIPLIWVGAKRAIEAGNAHRAVWIRHRTVVHAVLESAPQVQPGTIVVLTGVSKTEDPFGHDYWFDLAVRLLYPGMDVAGLYYYADQTAAKGDNLRLRDGRWEWDGTDSAPLVPRADLGRTLVVRYDGAGHASVVQQFPRFLCDGPCDGYDPASRIPGRTPSPEAVHRYGAVH